LIENEPDGLSDEAKPSVRRNWKEMEFCPHTQNKISKAIKEIIPIVLIFLLSCATTPEIQPLTPEKLLLFSCADIPKQQPPRSDELKMDLGRIGVISARFQPEIKIRKPMTRGTAAWQWAGEGALAVFKMNERCSGLGCLGFIFAPVGAVVGSMAGAVKGTSPEKIMEPEEALNSYLATLNFQGAMRDRLLSVASAQTQYPFILHEKQGPTTLNEYVNYGSLSEEGIDTVLEVSVLNFELFGLGRTREIDPSLRLDMDVGTKIIQTRDGKVLYSRIFAYRYDGSLHNFSEWGTNNAQLFRQEIDCAFQHLATEIVKTLTIIEIPDGP
jgi:hypothetical protein